MTEVTLQERIDEAMTKIHMVKESCDAIVLGLMESETCKLSERWFEGAADILGDAAEALSNVWEYIPEKDLNTIVSKHGIPVPKKRASSDQAATDTEEASDE